MTHIFDPGRMTTRLVLEAPVEAPDGQGGAAVTWEAVRVLWARVEPVRVSERQEAGAESATISYRIWIWFRDDVVAGQRFRNGSRVFAVKLVRDPHETRRFLVCHCEEVAA
nr:head-tail adaptor protein [Rhizobium sp. Khangiran2]